MPAKSINVITVPEGMAIVKVPADGDCFYHAMGLAFGLDHMTLRKYSVEFYKRLSEEDWERLRSMLHGGEQQMLLY